MSRVVSHSELQANNTRQNLWIVIHGKVYDVTKFTDEHPGGDEVIISEGGKDATEAFEDVGHSDEARGLLPGMLVGELEQGDQSSSKSQSVSSNPAVQNVVEQGSNLMYFIPLGLLSAYFAWRFYA